MIKLRGRTMSTKSWRILIVTSVLGAAVPGTNDSTMANTTLYSPLRTSLKSAPSGSEDLGRVLVDLAMKSIPVTENKNTTTNTQPTKFSVPSPAEALHHQQMADRRIARVEPLRRPIRTSRGSFAAPLSRQPFQPRMFALEERGLTFVVRPATLVDEWDPTPIKIDKPVQHTGPLLSLELLVKRGIERRTLKSDKWRKESLVQLNTDLTERHYAFVSARYDKSPDTGYEYRALVAPGIGYRVYNRDDFTWRIEAGAGARYDRADTPYFYEERFGLPVETKTSIAPAAMVASKIKWMPRENITVENSTMGVLSDSSSLSNLTSVTMPISKNMKAGFSFDMRFNTNRPYEDHSRAFDTIAKVTFKYTF
jgi:hypothetical protein